MSSGKGRKKKTSKTAKGSKTDSNVIQFEPGPSGRADNSSEPESSFDSQFEPGALGEAEEIVFEALNADTIADALEMAGKALSLSEYCADAYVLLADNTDNLDEAIELYSRGLEAAERVLGEEAFEEYAGNFWGVVETRPYMRALFRMGQSLEFAGFLEGASSCYYEMLLLNPNDNQGARYPLIQLLLGLDREEEAELLFEIYDEEIEASWNYSRALLDFKKHGDSNPADRSLKVAVQGNGFVPDYLLDHKELPDQLPDYYTTGDEAEAVSYAEASKIAWASAPGALAWLESAIKKK